MNGLDRVEAGYDVVVVGARAAGAATAMLLARRGLRVLAVDRGAYGTDTLSTHGGTLLDKASTLTVWLYSGELASVTEAQMFAGANWFAYGADGRWEIISAQVATLQGDGSYILPDFMRGQKGTEWATGLHAANDRLILLDEAALNFVSVNSSSIGSEKTTLVREASCARGPASAASPTTGTSSRSKGRTVARVPSTRKRSKPTSTDHPSHPGTHDPRADQRSVEASPCETTTRAAAPCVPPDQGAKPVSIERPIDQAKPLPPPSIPTR